MKKLTLHTMSAAKMVASRGNEGAACQILMSCGTKRSRAIEWLNKWANKDFTKVSKELLDVPF